MNLRYEPIISLIFSCLFVFTCSAQESSPIENQREKSWALHQKMKSDSPYRSLQWTGVGPILCGGRIESIATDPNRPATIYMGVGSGGLWKSINSGLTWKPIFDQHETTAIGDISVSKSNSNVLWLGTGEVLLSRSAIAGYGVYKSGDAGRTWKHMGLPDTQHIARVVIHPTNPKIVYLAAIGHQNSPNEQRGVFRTTDGGETWNKILYLNDHTSAIDLVMSPKDSNTMFACMWDRDVKGQNHYGTSSGVYKTVDGGDHWKQVKGGLPTSKNIGRIAIDIAPSNPSKVYALVDEGSKDGFYSSTDEGKTWKKINDKVRAQWDWCKIKVCPKDENKIYSVSQKSYVSNDGGRSFRRLGGRVVHTVPQGATQRHDDTHAIWINPNDPNHLMLGSDGGLYASLDSGKNWLHFNNLPIAECYALSYDDSDPYRIYIGTQDNGALFGPHTYRPAVGQNDKWKYVFLSSTGSADSYFTYRDKSDPNVIFYEHQYGGMVRKNMKTGRSKGIRPRIRNERLRFAWMTPFFPSIYQEKTLYAAANRVFKSNDKGDSWKPISPNLVSKDAVGNLRYRAITTLRESPIKKGTLFAGTDNGDLHVTVNDGNTWQSINNGLPRRFISRVFPSPHNSQTVFVSLNGAGIDDFQPYVFRSDDLGKTWHSISKGLPDQPINVVYEDPLIPNLLYVGTEKGIFASKNGGKDWFSLCNNLPTVSVFDMFIHPKKRHLVIGTHGRSCFLLDAKPIHDSVKPNPKNQREDF